MRIVSGEFSPDQTGSTPTNRGRPPGAISLTR